MPGISPENPPFFFFFFRTQSYVIVNLLTHDWLFRFTVNTEGKACSSNRSSRLWGGALRDYTKNGGHHFLVTIDANVTKIAGIASLNVRIAQVS